MQSKFLKKYVLDKLIHFESEDQNYFQNAFSSDVDNIVCNLDDENSWCSMDLSNSDKPLTVLLDLEGTAKGRYTGKVKGFYLFDMNIKELKTYEGNKELLDKAEYYKFDSPLAGLVQEVDSPIDETSFGYAENVKDIVLEHLCN